jgi:hypothetical protein
MKRSFTVSLVTLVALASLKPAAAQTAPSFQIIDIPLLAGAKENYPAAINNLGQVSGGTRASSDSSKIKKGWVWTPATGGAAAKIEALSPTPEFGRSFAFDINDAGTAAGKSSGINETTFRDGKATLWLKGQYTMPVDLNADPLKAAYLSGWTLRKAAALSNPDADGGYYVVCDAEFTGTGTPDGGGGVVVKMQNRAMIQAVHLQPVDAAPLGPAFYHLTMNTLGQVCGEYYDAGVASSPHYRCIWNGQDGVLLTSLMDYARVYALNDNGTIAGEYSSSTQGGPAYVNAAPYDRVDLLMAPNGTSGTDAYGLNNKNQLVGQIAYAGSQVTLAAAFWQIQADPLTGQPLRDGAGNLLYTCYDLSKCSLTGTTALRQFTWAWSVNDSGWITGRGTASNAERAFVLIPR